VNPLHYGLILGEENPELERLGDEFAHLSEWRPQVGRRAGELKRELARMVHERPDIRTALDAAIAHFSGIAGEEETWERLDKLIQQQYWRPAYFRVAGDDINYRRFFNINELAGLRMELPDLFEHVHVLAFQLLSNGILDGLRIDHIDGLLNPKEYLQRLRAGHSGSESFYLIVEKILARFEGLREDWHVDGTTGYEFANLVLGLLIDPTGENALTNLYTTFTGESKSFLEIIRESKVRIMRNEMASELHMLAWEALAVAEQNPCTADFTHNVLRRALREVIACFPVYRTYVDSSGTLSGEDRRYLDWALKQARARKLEVDASVFDFVEGLLSGNLLTKRRKGVSPHDVLRCAMKVQQYSGPVMAKGLEDTAFYRYNRFIALNEVGGDPDQFGISISTFHKANAQRAKRWPNSMVNTSTHDTKRGEDTRARLAVLSEIPQEWEGQVKAWNRILRARKGDIEGNAPPDPNDEYLFYQMLIGSWPAEFAGFREINNPALLQPYVDRLKVTMTKSLREAKLRSNWSSPNEAYEQAVLSFIDTALDRSGSSAFFLMFLPFAKRVSRLGVQNSLVQTALKLTVPGVPDIYQGSELWNLSMVDPDNRRPVDYGQRECLQQRAEQAHARELLHCWRDGAIKLLVTQKLLGLRQAEPELFAKGDYEPLVPSGFKADRICGFIRRHEGKAIIVLTALFPARRDADPDWAETTVPLPIKTTESLVDEITGAELPAGDSGIEAEAVFRELPVAVFSLG
jgi:(1->4)-alpha-D-glucan 1-alpha-D-glucosylmutase